MIVKSKNSFRSLLETLDHDPADLLGALTMCTSLLCRWPFLRSREKFLKQDADTISARRTD